MRDHWAATAAACLHGTPHSRNAKIIQSAPWTCNAPPQTIAPADTLLPVKNEPFLPRFSFIVRIGVLFTPHELFSMRPKWDALQARLFVEISTFRCGSRCQRQHLVFSGSVTVSPSRNSSYRLLSSFTPNPIIAAAASPPNCPMTGWQPKLA